MKVMDVMTKNVVFVDKDVDLKHVLDLMKKHEITKLPVVEDKKLIGVITDNMIAYKLGSKRKKGVPASRLHASSVTDKNVEIVSPETDITNILKMVGEPGPTILMVIVNETLVGVVTKADLLPLVKSNKSINEIMRKEIFTVSADDRVIHARRIMIDNDIARLPVLDKGKIIGVISDNEIAFALADVKRNLPLGRQKHRLDTLQVRDVMRIPPIWSNANITVKDGATIMIEKNVGFLPIIKDEKLVGVVSRTDLIKTVPTK